MSTEKQQTDGQGHSIFAPDYNGRIKTIDLFMPMAMDDFRFFADFMYNFGI